MGHLIVIALWCLSSYLFTTKEDMKELMADEARESLRRD